MDAQPVLELGRCIKQPLSHTGGVDPPCTQDTGLPQPSLDAKLRVQNPASHTRAMRPKPLSSIQGGLTLPGPEKGACNHPSTTNIPDREQRATDEDTRIQPESHAHRPHSGVSFTTLAKTWWPMMACIAASTSAWISTLGFSGAFSMTVTTSPAAALLFFGAMPAKGQTFKTLGPQHSERPQRLKSAANCAEPRTGRGEASRLHLSGHH